ncbi:DUF3466 family protein [Methylomonas sp. 11b]|uniref:DUF3466 family protein n=1 Tax=Methylomonas sp. 11b TaxID=1168169 RepID=UPI00047BFB0B|nr:DUF3466 family protein [Methylomonas sp. 11b]
MPTFKQAAITVFFCCSFLANLAHGGVVYNITDLGTLPGRCCDLASYGLAVNDSGQVTGLATTATSTGQFGFVDPQPLAFVSNSSGSMTGLGFLAQPYSYGHDINNLGQVTGYSVGFGGGPRAFIAEKDQSMIDLGVLPGGSSSVGNSINDAGQITGWADVADGSRHAFISDAPGQMMDIGLLAGYDNSEAKAINASGQITGSAFNWVGTSHAFVSESNGSLVDLGTLGGDSSAAFGINDLGLVVGSSAKSDGETHAFVTDDSKKMIDLGVLFNGSFSVGYGINNIGQIVGVADDANGKNRAFIFDNGVMKDLNTLLMANFLGWDLLDARGINSIGQIAGTGVYNGKTRAYLLTPTLDPEQTIPEPNILLLFLTGFCLLAFNRARRVGQ